MEEQIRRTLSQSYPYGSRAWRQTYQRVLYNIEQNPHTLLSKYTLDELVTLKHEDLRMNTQTQEDKAKEYQELLKTDYGGMKRMVTCRCGNVDVQWHIAQTRSADEGFTIFCHCPACLRRWTLS